MAVDTNLLSIGALSRATGVPSDTLRTWERRYGFPAPERTESGHRRYSMGTLERLRLVVKALEAGHRPGHVLSAGPDALRDLLERTTPSRSSSSPEPEATPMPPLAAGLHPAIERWLGHVERLEGRALDRELRANYAELGGHAFLEQRVGPFLVEIGERWERGAIAVRHEHFASERLREVLVELWRPLSDAGTGGLFVCAAPPGERHVLGLHMAALTLALCNARLMFLGADTPVLEIARTAEQHHAEGIALSASPCLPLPNIQRDMAELRALVPAELPIVAGGAGFAGRTLPGILVMRRFSELRAFMAARA